MSLFESASLVVTPNGTKASKLYAVKPVDGSGDLTVTRATTATRVNSAGLIESVAVNVPRLDYTNGSCPSILVEPQRTNSILNSATGTNQTVIVGNVPYTISFYGSGTVALSGTHTASVVGLGTARKTYTFTPTAGVLIVNSTGTVTNIQLEAGSYATSYIPTTSASVTRNADVISKTGISSLIGQTEGTMFCEIQNWQTQLDKVILALSDGSTSNYLQISSNSVTGDLQSVIFTGGTPGVLGTIVPVIGQNYKIAIGYKLNDYAIYINGTQVGTFNSKAAPSSLTRFDLGSIEFLASNYQPRTPYKVAAIWKTRLTNAELAELTTI